MVAMQINLRRGRMPADVSVKLYLSPANGFIQAICLFGQTRREGWTPECVKSNLIARLYI